MIRRRSARMAALLAAAALALTACAGSDDKRADDGGDRASLATTSDADWKPVADILLGRTGKLNDGSLQNQFARSDLSDCRPSDRRPRAVIRVVGRRSPAPPTGRPC